MKTNINQVKEILSTSKNLKEDLIKSNTSLDDKSIKFEIKSIKNDDNKRLFTAIATDSSVVDSDYEVVLSSGCDYTTRYMNNPVLLYEHDLENPMGKVISLEKNDKQIIITGEIVQKPMDYIGEFYPDYIWSLMQQGVIKAVSIRYIPLDWRYPKLEDKQIYGNDVKRIITKYILCEISLTSLPSNHKTLITDVNNSKSLTVNVDSVNNVREKVAQEVKSLMKKEIAEAIKDDLMIRYGFIYKL